MNSKGKEQIAGQIVKTIKAVLHEKKSVPIMKKDKEDPGADNEGTEVVTTTTELDTNQKNLKNGMHSNNASVDKQPGTLSLDITGTRSSVRQKKTPKSMSSDFFLVAESLNINNQLPVNSPTSSRSKTTKMVHKKK